MPFIRVTVFGLLLAPDQVAHLQNETTNLMELVLGKVASLTSVLVEQPSAANWTIGRDPSARCGSCQRDDHRRQRIPRRKRRASLN